MRKMVSARKELRLQENDRPYADYLKREAGIHGNRFQEWFPEGSNFQKGALDIVYEHARRGGMEIESLVLDLSKRLQDREKLCMISRRWYGYSYQLRDMQATSWTLRMISCRWYCHSYHLRDMQAS
jgi:hypothetical protein